MCCFEDIGTHAQRDKRKLKLLLREANDAWSSLGFKKNKVNFKKIPESKNCFSHQIPRESKMIFNEKLDNGISLLPRP